MKRLAVAFLLVAVVACTRGGKDDRTGPSADLTKLARSGEKLAYKATYRFEIVGPTTSNIEGTRFSIAQRPPDVVRSFGVTIKRPSTKKGDAATTTTTSWIVRHEGRTYACDNLSGTSCLESPGPLGTFGYRPVDEALDLARTAVAFAAVKTRKPVTIAGEQGKCYEAAGRKATAPPVTSPQPRYQPMQFSYELCWSKDGILLRMRRTALGPVPTGTSRARMVLEASEVSRSVHDSDLDLPGPIRTPPPPTTPKP